MLRDAIRVVDRLKVWLGGKSYSSPEIRPDNPTVEGYVRVCLRDKDGQVVPGSQREGKNVITLYGKEWLARHMCWSVWGGSPDLSTPDADGGAVGTPDHCVLYIGVGTGGVLEQASVSQLGAAASYTDAPFLYRKEITTPVVHPSATTSRFEVEFLVSDISTPGLGTQIINEFGLYLDNTDVLVPDEPPIAYKVTEPLPKTSAYSMLVQWEVRFV